jgi:hypothetical protein
MLDAFKAAGFVAFLLFLSACSQIPVQSAEPPPLERACVGTMVIPRGLAPLEDKSQLKYAQKEPLLGGLCTAKEYIVLDSGIRVYRASGGPAPEWGHWWSFDKPSGSKAAYRKANDICDDWNTLEYVASFTLTPGSVIVVGTGQSASCGAEIQGATDTASTVLLPSPLTQVYIPNPPTVCVNCAESRW